MIARYRLLARRIQLELDGGALGGDSWHTELLRQMSMDVPGVRPPVLQPDTAARLDEYRKFRHRIRNIYAFTSVFVPPAAPTTALGSTGANRRGNILCNPIFSVKHPVEETKSEIPP